MNLTNASGAELVAEYNRLAPRPIKRFATRADAIRRIAELRARKYPLQNNEWHARNQKRSHREVIELVARALREHAVANAQDKAWGTVRLSDAAIPGMDPKIFAGHLCQLAKEGRYKSVKPGVGAVLVAVEEPV